MSNLKLFVWEGDDILPVARGGIICVLAHDIDEALALIRAKYNDCSPEMFKHYFADYFLQGTIMALFPANGYRVIEQPEAFAMRGSDY